MTFARRSKHATYSELRYNLHARYGGPNRLALRLSLTYLTHSIPVPAPRLKIAVRLGHGVRGLAVIRTVCAPRRPPLCVDRGTKCLENQWKCHILVIKYGPILLPGLSCPFVLSKLDL